MTGNDRILLAAGVLLICNAAVAAQDGPAVPEHSSANHCEKTSCRTPAASSQDQSEDGASASLDPITVTATHTASRADKVSRSVSVVGQERIRAGQATDVLSLLQELPGVSSASNGGLAGQLVIRGFSTQSFRAPLFVDGDRFRGRNTLEYSLFNPDQIERIEVVRGPASSLYGTDSFGGIINIITKRATGDINGPFKLNDNEVSARYNSALNGYDTYAQVGGVGRGFDFLLSGDFRKGSQYDSPVGDIPNAKFETPSFNFRGGYTFAPGQRIGLTARYTTVDRERAGGQFAAPGAANGPGVPQRKQHEEPTRDRYLRLHYDAESLFDGALQDVEASLYRRKLSTHINVIPDARNPKKFVDVFVNGPTVTGGRFKALSNLTDSFKLTYGGDWYLEQRGARGQSVSGGARRTVGPKSEQLDVGVFALGEWQALESLRLDASLRYDYVRTGLDTGFIEDPTTRMLFQDAGDTRNNPVTGGLGAVWNVTDVASVFGHVSTAFRAPSVTEVSAVGSGVRAQFRIPNNDIKPERAINYEAGLRLRWPSVQANITGFVNNIDNLIDRNVPVTFQGIDALQIQNVGKSRISGVETQVIWLPSDDWLVRANATYTHGEDTQNNRPLPQIPPLNGLVGARWEPTFGNYYVGGNIEWSVDHNRVDTEQERETDGYVVAGLNAGYRLGQRWPTLGRTTVRFSVDNLFDTKYRLPTTPADVRFPQSPSNPLVELGRSFKIGFETHF